MPIKKGDEVSVHYVGTLKDGTEFDSSRGREPLTFKVGSGMVIPGFDKAVIGREVGDSFTVTIPCAEAYGEADPNAFITLPRSQMPAGAEPKVGMQLMLRSDQGMFPATISAVTDTEVTLDCNPPMAGKDLTFAMEIMGVK